MNKDKTVTLQYRSQNFPDAIRVGYCRVNLVHTVSCYLSRTYPPTPESVLHSPVALMDHTFL